MSSDGDSPDDDWVDFANTESHATADTPTLTDAEADSDVASSWLSTTYTRAMFGFAVIGNLALAIHDPSLVTPFLDWKVGIFVVVVILSFFSRTSYTNLVIVVPVMLLWPVAILPPLAALLAVLLGLVGYLLAGLLTLVALGYWWKLVFSKPPEADLTPSERDAADAQPTSPTSAETDESDDLTDPTDHTAAETPAADDADASVTDSADVEMASWHLWYFWLLLALAAGNIPLFYDEALHYVGQSPETVLLGIFLVIAGVAVGVVGMLAMTVLPIVWPLAVYYPLLWLARNMLPVADPVFTARVCTGVALLLWWVSLYLQPDPETSGDDRTVDGS